jgi:hypothetical protein
MLSEIFKGKRPMGRKTIETLSRFFHVAPGVFFSVPKSVAGKVAPSPASPRRKVARAASPPEPRGNAGVLSKDGKDAASPVPTRRSKGRKP